MDLIYLSPTYILPSANFLSNWTVPFLTQCWAPTVRNTITNDLRKDRRENLAPSLQPPSDQFGYHGRVR